MPDYPEQYTIRRKFFRLFGAAFHVYDAQDKVVGYCKQKSFRIREDIRIYTDESKSKELLSITTKSIIDFSGTYFINTPDGQTVGMMRRKGLVSTFFRDEWEILSPKGEVVAKLREKGGFLSFARRYVDLVSIFSPQQFEILRNDGSLAAVLRQHFNIFVYRMGIAIIDDERRNSDGIEDLTILAAACLVSAIEGKQDSA
jgi:uncharacterized protein YxjI